MSLLDSPNQAAWDAFHASQPYAQFLQSWAWGEFRASLGYPVRRFALLDDDGVWLAATQMEFRKKRAGIGFWFAPRGPVFASSVSDSQRRDVLARFTDALLKRGELRRGSLFWRMEPVSELSRPEGVVPLSFRRSSAQNPATTVLIDVTRSHDELLRAMHEKTRYNIRVAERFNVRVRVATTEKDLSAFLDLMDETAARDKFIQHSRSYLASTYAALASAHMAKIRMVELEGKLLAASLEVSFGDTVTYLYGASSSEHRNVMAPYALHWQAIQEAKVLGFKTYDLWGANPQSKAMYYYKLSWEGISRFKSGWGGRLVNLVGTWDLPFHFWIYRLAFPRQFFRG